MITTVSSIDELKATNNAIANFKKDYPKLFETLLEMVNLTRAFHFKYHFMGCLIMEEDPGESTPNVYGSVLRLYKKEMQKLKDDKDFQVLQQLFSDFRGTSYPKICLLVLGMTPESLVGLSYIK
jgi:hypothetical protein